MEAEGEGEAHMHAALVLVFCRAASLASYAARAALPLSLASYAARVAVPLSLALYRASWSAWRRARAASLAASAACTSSRLALAAGLLRGTHAGFLASSAAKSMTVAKRGRIKEF